MSAHVLVVDDEDLIRKSLTSVLEDEGYRVQTAADGTSALEHVRSDPPDIAILDMRLPDCDGLNLLRDVRQIEPAIRVIMITAHGDVEHAVDAMKSGAVDFLKKPYELDEILHSVSQVTTNLARDRRLDLYRNRDRASFDRAIIVGESPTMKRVWETVEKVATSNTTSVLLGGESGTGKELFAKAVHHLSERADFPMVEVNCSSFQEQLLENELFGHEKGAFTGATQLKRGLVELCDGGTLFLDEVGEMPVVTQAKLLRFIDNQTFRRVGGGSDITVNLRIVAATNVDLAELVEDRTFRKDLYYRLKVVALQLPPLRERGGDGVRLAEHFLAHFSRQFRKDFRAMSPEVTEWVRRYDWPGNVRELKNLIERVVLLEEGTELELKHLPEDLLAAVPDLPRKSDALIVDDEDLVTLRDAGDRHIVAVLRRCDGNRSQAARVLDISRQHLITRLKRIEALGIDVAAQSR